MRANEFLFEDYNQQLQSDLTNLLVSAKGNGASDLDTAALARELQNMGYSVDEQSILTLLQNNPNITSSTPDQVQLNTPNATGSAVQGQDSASRVGDMAQKATKIG